MTVPEPSPKLSLTPASIDFETTKTEGTITVSNTGGGTLIWSIKSDFPAWLKASLMKGETVSGKPTSVVLTVNRQNINPGTYKHTLSFTSNGGNGSVSVSMTVPEPQPILSINPNTLDFGDSTAQSSFTLSNNGGGTLTWQATKQQNWLIISPISGSLTSGKSVTITASVVRQGLTPGSYKDTISITSNGGNGSITVNMTISEPEKPPLLSLKPTSINFGQTNTQSSFTISNIGGRTLTWQASKQQNWLTVNPLNGSITAGNSLTASVTISRTGLVPGAYTDTISITSNGGSARISISISVPSPKLTLTPTSIDFGDKNTQSSITISNTGGGTLSWRATKQQTWLTLSSSSGTVVSERSVTVTLTVSRTGLDPGTYNDTVAFTSNGGNINLPITMVIPVAPAILLVNQTTLNLGEVNTQGSFTITNTGGETLTWKAVNQQSWLTVNPSGGNVASGKSMNVSINVSRVDLNSGVYNDTISITSNGGNSSVNVSITVPPPKLSFNPVSIDFGEISTQNSFNVSNTGGGTLTWQVSKQQAWLTINPTNGSITSGKTATVSLTISRTGLNPGTYKDTIAISSNGGNGSISISMIIPVPSPKLSLDPTALNFGETTTQSAFTITNSGGQTLTWQATKQNNWLTLSSSSGSLAPGRSTNITVTVSRAGLNSGTYTDLIAVTSNGGESNVSVKMVVPSPKLSFNPVSIDFGETTAQSSITISNTGGGIMTWQMSKQQPWLTLSNANGTLEAGKPLTILVSVSRTGLAPGTYTDNISITSNGGNGNIQVRMIIPQPLLSISPTTLDFGEKDTQKTFTITNAGGGSLNWFIEQTTETPGWITVSPLKGSLISQESSTITVNVDRTYLDSGDYRAIIRISSNGGDGQVIVNVSVPQSILLINPLSLDFGTTLTQLPFTITNNGGGFLEWQVSSRLPSWITSIAPNKGTLSAGSSTKVSVDISRTNMEDGIYTFSVLISSDGGEKEIQITMEVKAPRLNVSVRSLSFGAKTNRQTLILSNTGGGILTWNANTSHEWISIYPSEGTITSGGNISISVEVSRDGLKSGDYSGTLFISSNGGEVRIPVSMSVWLNVDPQFLDFGIQANIMKFTISNVGTEPITWTATSNVNWAVVNPAKGTTDPGKSTVVQVEVSRRLLKPRAQPYTGVISVISDSGTSYVTISVSVPILR
ncbi:MAG: BACON domain-containing protein [bacterium]